MNHAIVSKSRPKHDQQKIMQQQEIQQKKEPLFLPLSLSDWIATTLTSYFFFVLTAQAVPQKYHFPYLLGLMLPSVFIHQLNEKRISPAKKYLIAYSSGILFFIVVFSFF